MNRNDAPAKQAKPFGINGQREDILPTTPTGDNTASYESGFPPITMILKSAGGLPPKGQDMNQILFELSALGRWSSAGALNTFDSDFAAAITGYPSGSVVISDDGNTIYVNTVDANTSDPDSGGAGWKPLTEYLQLGDVAKTGIAQVESGSTFITAKIPFLSGGNKRFLMIHAITATMPANTNGYNLTVTFPTAYDNPPIPILGSTVGLTSTTGGTTESMNISSVTKAGCIITSAWQTWSDGTVYLLTIGGVAA